MFGPRGIPKKPIFGNINDLDKSAVGTKRKKISDGHNEFEGDNLKTNPWLVIDRGPKDVFAEGSSNSGLPLGDERAAVTLGERNLGLMEDNGKKRKAGTDTEVREGQGKDDLGRGCDDHLFQEIRGTRNRGGKSNKPESLLALEQDDGLFEDEEVAKSESRPDPESGLPTGMLHSDQSKIVVRFNNTLGCADWICYFVYAPPVRSDRKMFWENLALEMAGLDKPWTLIGDLNSILNQGEKFGGTSGSHGDFEDLSNFLLMTGGVDLGSVGNFYTWTNNRKFSTLIKERLDRVIGDPKWILSYPKAGVKVLTIRDSDHAPMLLDLYLENDSTHRPFRYLEAWIRDPSCYDVVKEAWTAVVRGCFSFQLISKLHRTKRALAKWNKEFFGMCKSKLDALEKLLLEVQSRPPSLPNTDNANDSLRSSIVDALGVRRMEASEKFSEMNLALITKLGWALAKGGDAPWCQVLKAKYCKWGSNFWNATLPSNASWGARGIFASREFIRQESCWLVGNGHCVDLWTTPWTPWLDWDSYLAAFNPNVRWPVTLSLEKFILSNGSLDINLLSQWFRPDFLESLRTFVTLPGNSDDLLIWKDSPNGLFSVKAAHASLIKNRSGNVDVLFKRVWNSSFLERVKLFLWKVGKDILPCGKRLKVIYGRSFECVLCSLAEDTLEHLFFHCPLARGCWFKSRWGIRSDSLTFSSSHEILHWLLNPHSPSMLSPMDLHDLSSFAVALAYTLWNARNKAFHDGFLPSVDSILHTTMTLVQEIQIDGNLVLNHVGGTPPIPSAVDLLGEFNVFVDAAVKDNMAFLAVLSLDKQGEVIEAFSVKTWVKSPLEAETMAICHAISRCQEHGWMNACIFSDCKVAVEAAAARKVPCWKSTAWFLQLFNRLEVAVNTKVVWIPRSLNSNAHLLAKWAASHNFSTRQHQIDSSIWSHDDLLTDDTSLISSASTTSMSAEVGTSARVWRHKWLSVACYKEYLDKLRRALSRAKQETVEVMSTHGRHHLGAGSAGGGASTAWGLLLLLTKESPCEPVDAIGSGTKYTV
ncbi:hypothetical protein G4B88_002319 [Cannabis sativa]|uniref:Reverse transcriptase zinc-binding domain-containing protein n=1 Tax=Cannabis sativa TaxID=3483 RepID=A0A7J6EWX4_CANSA|nr:hypothetical protein G4B88_002319 [Cannabis sativa]